MNLNNKFKKIASFICIIGVLITSNISALAADIPSNITSGEATSISNIGEKSNTKMLRAADVSGVAAVKLNAIGSGLVDADWSVIMSKGLLTNINMTLTIKHGFLYLSSTDYPIWRKANWTKAEYGVEQSSWDVGTKLKCDLNGTIEVNGQFDYPVNTFDYGVTTVK